MALSDSKKKCMTAKRAGSLPETMVGRKVPLLGERGEAFVAVENLFDEDYSFRAGYPMPGRSYQFGLRFSF